jgi:hypothetical protein
MEEGNAINIVIDCNLQAAPEFVVRDLGGARPGRWIF